MMDRYRPGRQLAFIWAASLAGTLPRRLGIVPVAVRASTGRVRLLTGQRIRIFRPRRFEAHRRHVTRFGSINCRTKFMKDAIQFSSSGYSCKRRFRSQVLGISSCLSCLVPAHIHRESSDSEMDWFSLEGLTRSALVNRQSLFDRSFPQSLRLFFPLYLGA